MEELASRFELIEKMIQEGRQSIEKWGWAYTLWGVGHLLGVAASLTHTPEDANQIWGILMGICGALMGIGFALQSKKRKQHGEVVTQTNRSLSAIWWAFMFVLAYLFSSPSSSITPSTSAWFGIFSVAYGGAFFASGYVLTWKPMMLNGFLWFGTGLILPHLNERDSLILYGLAAFIGEVGFGIYTMIHERKSFSSGR